jgi:hypothetical protein
MTVRWPKEYNYQSRPKHTSDGLSTITIIGAPNKENLEKCNGDRKINSFGRSGAQVSVRYYENYGFLVGVPIEMQSGSLLVQLYNVNDENTFWPDGGRMD